MVTNTVGAALFMRILSISAPCSKIYFGISATTAECRVSGGILRQGFNRSENIMKVARVFISGLDIGAVAPSPIAKTAGFYWYWRRSPSTTGQTHFIQGLYAESN